MLRRAVVVGIISLGLSACATVLDGTDQWITVTASPAFAKCAAVRDGIPQDVTGPEKAQLHVSKSRKPLIITCEAPGHISKTVVLESSLSNTGAVGIGFDLGLTDYATGALNKYPDTVEVNLALQSGR